MSFNEQKLIVKGFEPTTYYIYISVMNKEIENYLLKLRTLKNFADSFPSKMKGGKKGVSIQYILKILEKYECNFELIKIDGVNFIYLNGQKPEYKTKKKENIENLWDE